MSLSQEQIGCVTILTPHGDLDLSALPSLEVEVDRLLAGGVRFLLWDLDEVGMMPSTAAGFLLQIARRLHAQGGRLALTRVPERVKSTLGIMGVRAVLPLYAGRAEALAALQPRPA